MGEGGLVVWRDRDIYANILLENSYHKKGEDGSKSILCDRHKLHQFFNVILKPLAKC